MGLLVQARASKLKVMNSNIHKINMTNSSFAQFPRAKYSVFN